MASSAEPDGATRRLVTVLGLLAEKPEAGVSVRGAADATGISRSSMHRMLSKLADAGVARSLSDGSYAAGPKAYEWASKFLSRSSLYVAVTRAMEALVGEFDESVYFAQLMPKELSVAFLRVVECRQPIKYVLPIGLHAPLYAGAAGKAVLAWLPPATLDRLEFRSFTVNTITDRQDLERELDEIRTRGFAVSIGERVAEAAGVSAPIFSEDGPIGSLSLTIPRSRLEESNLPVIGQHVARAAEELTPMVKALWPRAG